MKHEKAPTAPRFVYANVLENQSFWAILANLRWPQLSKGTSIRQDLSYEPIPKSLRPSIAKKQPGKAQVPKNRYFGHFAQIRPFPVAESG